MINSFQKKNDWLQTKPYWSWSVEHHWSLCSKFASFGFVNLDKLIGSIPCTPSRGIFSSFALPKTPWGSQMEKTKDTSHHNHQLWSTMNGQYISYVIEIIECLLPLQWYSYLHYFVFSVSFCYHVLLHVWTPHMADTSVPNDQPGRANQHIK